MHQIDFNTQATSKSTIVHLDLHLRAQILICETKFDLRLQIIPSEISDVTAVKFIFCIRYLSIVNAAEFHVAISKRKIQ